MAPKIAKLVSHKPKFLSTDSKSLKGLVFLKYTQY